MRLILFRHGPAGRRDDSRWPDDAQRPLSSRGEARTRAAARGLSRLEPEIHTVVTSPLVRAAATARLLAEALGDADLETLDSLRPGGSWRQVIAHLANLPPGGTVVLVGHEPDLGLLAGTLVFGAPSALPLKKAGACAIVFEGAVAAGKGQLAWFLPPRFLRRRVGSKRRLSHA
jgi:phosphohistidine phosphatase